MSPSRRVVKAVGRRVLQFPCNSAVAIGDGGLAGGEEGVTLEKRFENNARRVHVKEAIGLERI